VLQWMLVQFEATRERCVVITESFRSGFPLPRRLTDRFLYVSMSTAFSGFGVERR
jgi:hypothetical protein